MLYTTSIIVKVPLDVFVSKMNHLENMKHWQRGLKSLEHLSGNPGELGSRLKLTYDFGRRKVEITETITKSNFPHEFHASYSGPGMNNTQENYFSTTAEGFTEWKSVNRFVPLNFRMRALMFLMPRVFKKQAIQYMEDFKNFVEHGTSVNDA